MKRTLFYDLSKIMIGFIIVLLASLCVIVAYNNMEGNAPLLTSTTVLKGNDSKTPDLLGTSIQGITALDYFEGVAESKNTNTLKKGFVKVVDFLFYGEKFNGVTFDELKDEIKLKIVSVAYKIDSKIDSLFPGCKEKIKSAVSRIYTKVKERLTELYIKITTAICNYRSSICENAKADFAVLKEKFGLTFDFLKGLFNSGKEKLNDWYLNFREE